MIDYNALPLSKGKTRAEAKKLRDSLRKRIDRLESAKVRVRSGGRCEVRLIDGGRCGFGASEVHHMIGGGQRAKGPSLLADHKQHVCASCHLWITGDIGGKKLKLIQFGDLPRWDDRYWRCA